MLTFAEIGHPDAYRRAPRIERGDVRLLYHVDFWDGPISGLLVYRGEECWFAMVAESDPDRSEECYRHFVILRLTAAQLAEEHSWHALFRQKVGTHTDDDGQGRRLPGALQPRDRWREFYDAYRRRTPPDFAGNEVLGWFEF